MRRALRRRSAMPPSRRQTTPTSTRTGRAARRVILDRPVVALDRFAEALGDRVGLAMFGQIGNQEAEFVAAESRMQFARARSGRSWTSTSCDADLLAQQLRDADDDPIADGMTERVVVPLEAGDIDQADGAPAAALLERQERFELLGEAGEIHQLGLGIALRFVGQVGDQLLEVARRCC